MNKNGHQFQQQWKCGLPLICAALLLLLHTSCTPKTASKTVVAQPEPVYLDDTEVSETTTKAPVEKVEKVEPVQEVRLPYQILRLEKTACFGNCPSFEIKLFSDGRAQWNGKHHIDRLGIHEAYMDDFLVKSILARAQLIGYFSLNDHYPVNGKYLSDLPNTITYLNDGGLEKSILRNHNGPKNLLEFEDFLFQVFDRLSWQKLASN